MAVAANSKSWMRSSEGYESGKTYPSYVCSLSNKELFSRTAKVALTSGLGAGAGAGIGAAVTTPSVVGIPAGAASGAFIGGMTGLGVGITASMIFDVRAYAKAYKNIKQDGGQTFSTRLAEADLDPSYLCGINLVPMVEPVRISGEPQLYERKVLEKWIKQNGTSPISRREITRNDLQFAAEGLAYNGRACHDILNNPQALAKFNDDEVVALKAYREDCVAVSSRFYKNESTKILYKAARLQDNPRASLAQLSQLVELMDPVVNINADEIGSADEEEKSQEPLMNHPFIGD